MKAIRRIDLNTTRKSYKTNKKLSYLLEKVFINEIAKQSRANVEWKGAIHKIKVDHYMKYNKRSHQQ